MTAPAIPYRTCVKPQTLAVALASSCFAACASGTTVSGDLAGDAGVVSPDVGSSQDMGVVVPDLGAVPDMGVPEDSGVAPDAQVPMDAGVPPDMGMAPMDAGVVPSTVTVMNRTSDLVLPTAHNGVTPLPLIVALHGLSLTGGEDIDALLGLNFETRDRGFYLVLPDGLPRAGDSILHWNATPACCGDPSGPPDDVAYLTALLDAVEALVPVRDVYFFGFSNGGFMSYRMACEASNRITAIATLAGSDFINDTDCVPAQPVSVLHMHGDMDEAILYGGCGETDPCGFKTHPSAPAVAARWAARAGCADVVTRAGEIDLVANIPGTETLVDNRNTGCTGGDVSLWTIEGAMHVTVVDMPQVLDWLDARRR